MAQVSVSTNAGADEPGIASQLLGYVGTWILPALASLLIIWLALSLTDFYYPHAWASAHFATIAHSFATHGIIGLHGIPIENFAPLTTQPDNYLHWPPFFFYVLSLVLRAFPESIRAMHLFMAVIAIANAYVMWLIASTFFKPRVAILCGSAFLLMPATPGTAWFSCPPTWACWEFRWRCCSCCVTCKALMPDAKGRWTSDSVRSRFFLLALPRGSRFWRCPDCCSRTASIADRRS